MPSRIDRTSDIEREQIQRELAETPERVFSTTQYQPLDTQLTSLASLSYTGNGGKFVRVNAGESGFELASVSGGEAFPVGSVFISVVSTSPSTLLGYGTWTAFGAGRVMVGLDAGDANFDTAEETGGSKTVASTGSVSAPTINGSTATEGSHTHSVTSNVTVADHAAHTHSVTSNVAVGNHGFTQPTIAWPAGVPTASGAAVGDHAAHTHSVTSNVSVDNHASHTHTYTEVPNHVHVQNYYPTATGGSTGTTVDTSMSGTPAASGLSTANPTGGVATGTTAGPSATLTHTVNNPAVTSGNPSATLTHSVTQPTIAWPAGVPTATGGAVDAHSVTNNAVTSGNPSATLSHTPTNNAVTSGAGSSHSHGAGTLAASAPTYTGDATSVVQPYIVCYFWKRTA